MANKGGVIVLGLLAAYWSTQLFEYTQKKLDEKKTKDTFTKMTEADMKAEIDLIVAMHIKAPYRAKSALDSKYEGICNSKYIPTAVKVYGLGLIVDEMKKIEADIKTEKEAKAKDGDINKSVAEFERAMNDLVSKVKASVEKMKSERV
jgi:hypothetical protein